MIFETHAHYDDSAFDEDRESILLGMQEHGIGKIVNVGASLASSKSTLALAAQYPAVYAAVGVHPDEAKELNEENFAWLEDAARQEKVVAIGEIGLDYYWDASEREIQKKWFLRQMELAVREKLPIIVHSREAAADTLSLVKQAHEAAGGALSGVIHCFSYGREMAEEYVRLGFYLGIGGVVTFKNAKKLKEVVEMTPLDRLVLETDSPYLAPEPNRGKRNCSYYLPYVAEAVAALKHVTAEEVIRQTTENAYRLYRLEGTQAGRE